MTLEQIADSAEKLRRGYGLNDPMQLASCLGMLVSFEPMGTHDGCCKGFFVLSHRIGHITINSDLPEALQRVVLAHELGHGVLHSGTRAAFHDFMLFDAADRTEYEANVFAAELLLSDEDVLEALSEDMFFLAAGILHVPAELLDFKLRIMRRRGYEFESPIDAHGDFLKKIESSLALRA